MSVEGVQAYWDRRPCNSQRSTARPGSRAWAEDVEHNKRSVEPHILSFLRPEDWAGLDVLDAGCGIGIMSAWLARQQAHVMACDLSPESLALAVRLCGHLAPRGDISFRHHNLEEPWPATYWRHFDLVFSFGVLHHTPDPLVALLHLRQTLKGTGELRLMLYHRRSTKALGQCLRHPWHLLRHGVDATVALQSEAQAGCPIARTYTPATARQLLAGAGYRVTRIEIAHIFPWAIGPYKKGQYQKTWYWRLVPEPVFGWLERRLGWHLLIWARPI